jgi:hypothetical protein
MSGGTISNNHAWEGGGIEMLGADVTFAMSGGSISNNTAFFGGGVFVSGNDSKFNMTGGEISGNNAESDGGGVTLHKDDNVIFNMSGGIIKNNSAALNGGGLYALATSTFNMTGGEITGNSAGGGDGVPATGVVLATTATFTGNPQIGSKVSGRGAIYNNVPSDLWQDTN